MRKHLAYLSGDAPVNPREVKRLLNAYTIQLKMLSARGVAVEPDVVLALQVIGFRRDWQEIYDRLTTEPQLMRDAIRDGGSRVPRELVDYVREAAPKLFDVELAPYISSARAVGESDIGLLEAQARVARMLTALDDGSAFDATVESEFRSSLSLIFEMLQRFTGRVTAQGGLEAAQRLEASLGDLTSSDLQSREGVVNAPRAQLNDIGAALRVLRRQTSVRAYA